MTIYVKVDLWIILYQRIDYFNRLVEGLPECWDFVIVVHALLLLTQGLEYLLHSASSILLSLPFVSQYYLDSLDKVLVLNCSHLED